MTIKCNPDHPNILHSLLDGSTPEYRQEIVARYFVMQVNSLLRCLKNKKRIPLFCRTRHYSIVIEFQKRGFPNTHILTKPILAHEHLYVALSRLGALDGVLNRLEQGEQQGLDIRDATRQRARYSGDLPGDAPPPAEEEADETIKYLNARTFPESVVWHLLGVSERC